MLAIFTTGQEWLIQLHQCGVCRPWRSRHWNISWRTLASWKKFGSHPVRNIASNNYNTSAAHLRDQYADYFYGAGSVLWQLKAVRTDYSCIINIICVNNESFCATGKMCKICYFGLLILLFIINANQCNLLLLKPMSITYHWSINECNKSMRNYVIKQKYLTRFDVVVLLDTSLLRKISALLNHASLGWQTSSAAAPFFFQSS